MMETKIPNDFWQTLSEAEQNQLYQMNRLLKVMSQLREPSGCPWDQEQTHASLKPYLLEETYEVLEQLEAENLEGMQEELGDLLLQVVFHAQIASENGHFSMEEVAKGIADKLIRRHPHIFGDVKAESTDEVLANWEKIKAAEKQATGQAQTNASLLDRVNTCQPALMEAQQLQAKAAKVGFDWDTIDGAIAKVREELDEVITARESGLEEDVAEEVGDLIFAAVNVARLAGCHSEIALRGTNRKFRRRFKGVEQKVTAHGQRMEDLSLQILDGYWDEVKLEERKKG